MNRIARRSSPIGTSEYPQGTVWDRLNRQSGFQYARNLLRDTFYYVAINGGNEGVLVIGPRYDDARSLRAANWLTLRLAED